MKQFSIVVPAYNEADKIISSLTQITSFMNTFSQSYEIVVVDDGSLDDTAARIETFARENPQVRLVLNPHRGKSPSVWTGVMKAEGEYIYLCDADLSAPISELKKLYIWTKDHNFDVVIASREGVGAQRINEPYYRHLMGRVFNLWVQLIALPGINDSQCGFKLLKGNVAKDIFGRLHIYGSEARQVKNAYFGAFDVEVLFIARMLKYRIKEVPVVWTYVKTSRLSPFRDSLKMALDVLKVRVNSLKGVYNAE